MENKCCEKCFGSISRLQWWCNDKDCSCHTSPKEVDFNGGKELFVSPKVSEWEEEFDKLMVKDFFGIECNCAINHQSRIKSFISSLIKDTEKRVVIKERQRIGQEIDLIWKDTHHDLKLFEQSIIELQEDLLNNQI